MMSLPVFLLARLDEDEAAAKAAGGASWEPNGTWWLEGVEHNVVGDEQAFCHPGNVTHIARHDPARVLADVEAKRRIVAEHPITDKVIPRGYSGPNAGFGCEVCHDWDGVTEGLGYCNTLKLLALPYADHPDYRAEWAV